MYVQLTFTEDKHTGVLYTAKFGREKKLSTCYNYHLWKDFLTLMALLPYQTLAAQDHNSEEQYLPLSLKKIDLLPSKLMI